MSGPNSYLACTYYPQSSDTSLYLMNPYDESEAKEFRTISGGIVMWPSWVSHLTNKTNHNLRVSVASDIVTEETMIANPWRPHILLDDPATMTGLH